MTGDIRHCLYWDSPGSRRFGLMEKCTAIACNALLCTAMISCGDGATRGPDSERIRLSVPHLVGEIDLQIGVQSGPEEEMFGRVSGLALDSLGRIFVADATVPTVRVFDTDGNHQFDIGRAGRGPGEFRPRGMGRIVFDSAGILWVVSEGAHAFRVQSDGASYLRTVYFARNNGGAPLMFAPDGHIIYTGFEAGSDNNEPQDFFVHVDTSGYELKRTTLPPRPPVESTDIARARLWNRTRTASILVGFSVPFTSVFDYAFGPKGRYARAITSHYAISIFDENGSHLADITRDTPSLGPELSAAERDSASRYIAREQARIGPHADMPSLMPPSHKAVLEGIWYDREGRLWVQLSRPDGDPALAHVYDRDHRLIMTAEWPAIVSFRSDRAYSGAIKGTVGLAVQRDELGVHRVVRVRFR